MNASEIITGVKYSISGDLDNGQCSDGKPHITHDEVVRVIKRVTETHIICECGRKFIINNNLKIA